MPVRTRRWHREVAAKRIQQCFRRSRAIDVITLARIPKLNVYTHVDIDSGHITYHDARVLAACFERSLDYRHPVSRKLLNRIQLSRLQRAARRTGYDANLLEPPETILASRNSMLESESLVEMLVDELQEVGYLLVSTVSDPSEDPDAVMHALQTSSFVAFNAAYSNLRAASPSTAHIVRAAILEDLRFVETIQPQANRLARSYVNLTFINNDAELFLHPRFQLTYIPRVREFSDLESFLRNILT